MPATPRKAGAIGAGGAVLSAFDETILINCTLYGNTADQGGGLASESFDSPANSGSVLIANSILWGNSDGSGSGQTAQIFNYFDAAPVASHSCIQGWDGSLSGTGVLDSDPLIRDPDGADNVLGTEDDDLHPAPSSPVIDAGHNAALPPEVTFDLAGNPRIDNGTVDMGVYERNDCGDGTCSLKENPCSCPGDCGTPASSESLCDDGVDNDCNALTDCLDPNCLNNPVCEPPPIPAVSEWGIVVMALLLLAVGTVRMKGQRHAA